MLIQRNQSGFALLLFVLVLMGIGGIALTGSVELMRKGIEQEKHDHNVRILNEAKQALLYYAYNYPNFNAQGPGHLPCPYDEIPGGIPGYSSALTLAICTSVGRLPFDDTNLNFNEVKDSDGEHLWYAVSDNFYNLPPGVDINSDTVGTISIFDQSGNLVYDGAISGIAAIIIAPGKAMARDDDGDGVYDYTQVRGTDAEKANPKNYLDAFNGFDNSTFINIGNANSDGFRLGPTFGTTNHEIVMNDQMVLITTAEIIEVAEKSVLDQYATVLEDYRSKTGAYPWLFDFNISLAQINADNFPSGSVLTNIGRIPSTFSNYFVHEDTNAYASELVVRLDKTVEISGNVEVLTLDVQSDVTSGVSFTTDGIGDIGTLTANAIVALPNTYASDIYFWDELVPNGWRKCEYGGDGADELIDCDNDMANAGVVTASILKVGLILDMSALVAIDIDYDTLLNLTPLGLITYPPSASIVDHAKVEANFDVSRILSLPVNVYYEKMDSYVAGLAQPFFINSNASQTVINNTNMGDLLNQSIPNITLGVRYYPELPTWAAASNEDWHKSIIMAIAPDYQPGVIPSNCVVLPCLTLSDRVDANPNKVSLLIMAGQNNYVDNGSPNDLDDLSDNVDDVFDPENANLDNIFSTRSGNDRIHIIQEN